MTTDPNQQRAEAAIAAAEGRAAATNDDENSPAAVLEARRREADAKLAEEYDCTPEEVAAARQFGMEVREYVGYRNARSLPDVERVQAELEAERIARRQLEHEQLVERARKRLAGES